MDETNLEDKLNELVKEFGEVPNPQYRKLAELAKQAQDNREKLEKSISTLQESLDFLRVCIKYQVFDLEATRRENTYLRKLLRKETTEAVSKNTEAINTHPRTQDNHEKSFSINTSLKPFATKVVFTSTRSDASLDYAGGGYLVSRLKHIISLLWRITRKSAAFFVDKTLT